MPYASMCNDVTSVSHAVEASIACKFHTVHVVPLRHRFRQKFLGDSGDESSIVERVYTAWEVVAPHLTHVCETLARKSRCQGVLLPFLSLITIRYKCSLLSYLLLNGMCVRELLASHLCLVCQNPRLPNTYFLESLLTA